MNNETLYILDSYSFSDEHITEHTKVFRIMPELKGDSYFLYKKLLGKHFSGRQA